MKWNVIVWISEWKQQDNFLVCKILFLLWFYYSLFFAKLNTFVWFNIWNVAMNFGIAVTFFRCKTMLYTLFQLVDGKITEKCNTKSIEVYFSFLSRGIILWIELPWPENPANIYARRMETLDSCFDLIRSLQQCIPWSLLLDRTSDHRAKTLPLSQ